MSIPYAPWSARHPKILDGGGLFTRGSTIRSNGQPEADAYVLVAPGEFDIVGARWISIPLCESHDSPPALFKLIPRKLGRRKIKIEFFQGGRYLGTVTVDTLVARRARPVNTTAAALAPSPTKITAKGIDLIMLFDVIPDAGGASRFRFRLTSRTVDLGARFVEFQTDPIHASPSAFLGVAFEYLERLHRDNDGKSSLFFDRLRSLGMTLYERLFPVDLRRLYWKRLRKSVKSMLVVSYEPWIPWELVHPFDPDTKRAETGFLCERFCFARWLGGAPPPPTLKIDIIGLVASTAGLPESRVEHDLLRKLFGDQLHEIQGSRSSIFRVLQRSHYSLLHFSCHGTYDEKSPEWSKLHLDDGVIYPLDVSGDKLRFGERRPFIFLNACQTGRVGYEMTGLGGWAQAFIDRAGSGGFVGANWKIRDDSAREFAVAFYHGLKKGLTIGDAARRARAKIKRAWDSSWLSYSVFADPNAKFEL